MIINLHLADIFLSGVSAGPHKNVATSLWGLCRDNCWLNGSIVDEIFILGYIKQKTVGVGFSSNFFGYNLCINMPAFLILCQCNYIFK